MTPRAARREAAVFDSSPLIFLARVGLLREAAALCLASLISESVREEVLDIGREIGAPETAVIDELLAAGGLTVSSVPETALSRRLESNRGLSRADRDSLVLATERHARLLADDLAVRRVARHLGIPTGGTLSCLFSLVEEGKVGTDDALGCLDRMVDAGWYCSAKLYRTARQALEGVANHLDRQ